jgi:hypothetical protein
MDIFGETVATIRDSTFNGNSAGHSGGGLSIDDQSGNAQCTVIDCVFNDNMTDGKGGGLVSYGAKVIITGCRISRNHNGGVHCFESAVTIRNTIVAGNNGILAGGITCDSNSESTFVGSTIVGNRGQDSGAIGLDGGSSATVMNCIFWDNSPTEVYNGIGTLVVSYCDVQDGWPGSGNTNSDPCFAKAGYWDSNGTPEDVNDDSWVHGDYHLKSEGGRWDPNSESWVLDGVTSPCIDTGNPHSSFGAELSPHGCRVNMGAYGNTEQASKSPVMASACCESYECAGQPYGDATCDGTVNLADLYALKADFGTSAPWADNQCCADFSHDGNVDLADLYTLKAGFATSGYSPSTGNQNCPP